MRQFLMGENKVRGTRTYGEFDEYGRITVTVMQKVPDSFFDDVKLQREIHAKGNRRSTQDHMVPTLILPDTLQAELLKDGNGRPLAAADPEREKRLRQIANDIDYRDCKVFEGTV